MAFLEQQETPYCVPDVSPVFQRFELPCSIIDLFEATVEGSLFRAERKRIFNNLKRTGNTVSR
jgi:hypothetical protein